MDTLSVVNVLIGLGMIGLLWKIQRELGGITQIVAWLKEARDDHEARIRAIEGRPSGSGNSPA